MIIHLRQVLDAGQLAQTREILRRAEWADGRATAGEQSSLAKRNQQLPERAPEALRLGEIVLEALAAHAAFVSAALPLRIFPPLFNRYGPGMGFGEHIDNAVRASPLSGLRLRTDLSCTLFLSDPETYDGGELVFPDGSVERRVKLAAGDAVLYPASTVHRVEPVTRGERLASFFWVQSMVRDLTQRQMLYDLDRTVIAVRARLGDEDPAAVALVGHYHNLIRMWAEL